MKKSTDTYIADLLAEIVTHDYWAGSICNMDTLNKGMSLIHSGEGRSDQHTTHNGDKLLYLGIFYLVYFHLVLPVLNTGNITKA